MRKSFLLSFFVLLLFTSFAQDTASKKGGTFSLNVGQGGSKNWAAGAEKFSFTVAAYLNVFANKRMGKYQ